jgi:uncharacterized protein (TIGR00375 family)
MMLQCIFADLHIHIGRTESGLPVKITAARNLTFDAILHEAALRKGIQMIGIIDAHSPPVQEEIARGLDAGRYEALSEGGIRFEGTTVIMGMELEVKRTDTGPAHVLAYFPDLERMQAFSTWISRYMKNIQLSTQRYHGEIRELEDRVEADGGLLIPAHVFTPFKSVYGSAVDRMADLFRLEKLAAVELGLSADSSMADRIPELALFSFVSNSDAHSLPKIAREYNEIQVQSATFAELRKALLRQDGRRVAANYGLNPKLGKYHRTRCLNCDELLPSLKPRCSFCGSTKVVRGVSDRIGDIGESEAESPSHRPPYVYQVPLEFIPKLGPKTLDKLLNRFGTEMEVLHRAPIAEIADTAGEAIARHIELARERRLEIEEGGGGTYGKVKQMDRL